MRAIVVALLLFCAGSAHARGVLREIRGNEPVVLQPDHAYLLFRTVRPAGVIPGEPIFLRIPTQAELDTYREARLRAYQAALPDLTRAYERARQRPTASGAPPVPPSLATFNFVDRDQRNVESVDLGHSFASAAPESTYLVDVPPGDYVLYGLKHGMLNDGLYVCLCLGTVGFQAAPGVITDLGYFLSDRVHQVSVLPELREESGFGPTSVGPWWPLGATVRPVRADSSMPASLRGLPIHAVHYRAVGRFVEARALGINRLAAVPGILEYDGGRVVDAATHQDVPDVN